MKIQLSKTSDKILNLLLKNGNRPLYINEIVRETNLYPNSIQRSLKTLENQEIVTSKVRDNKRFYSLNKTHKLYPEIKSIFVGAPSKNDENSYKYIKWVNREISVAFNTALGSAQCNPKYIKKFRIEPIDFIWYNSVTGGVYHSKEQIEKAGRKISKEIKRDLAYAKGLVEGCTQDGEKLITETQKSIKKDLPSFTEKQLYSEFNKLHELFLHFMPYVVVPVVIEKVIATKINEKVFDAELQEKLLEPVSVLSDEQIDELKLTALVKKDGWTIKNKRGLLKLTEGYCWLPMMALNHKPFDIAYFQKIIDELVVSVKDPIKELKKLKDREQDRTGELEKTLREIKADRELRNLVYVTQAYLNLRTYRVNVVKRFHYYHLSILNEIARRLKVSEEDITFLTYYEILDALKNKTLKKSLESLIKDRKLGFVNITWKSKSKVIAGVKNIIQAMEQYNILAQTPNAKREVRGNVACRGTATGTVKIVKKLSEIEKVQEGDVLVARMTTPDYMMAINKAVAIVTDEGGITCHAAIVSREFNIPCIVGTKNATQILSDGDVVEVDANEGIVRVVETADFSENIKELHGKSIYGGKVKGIARVILDSSDFDKLKQDDIVIAAQTTPEYLSLLYRAKGFVVDEESISSHAVLYGKALEIPSIMGTSVARFVIVDGERIELDATNGVVKRLT